MELIAYLDIFQYTRIGKWWHKDKEIDIVALNENTNEILFCECKWKNRKTDLSVIEELLEKSKFVDWNNDIRKERFAVFSKSGFTKDVEIYAKQKNLFLFTLDELDETFRRQEIAIR